MMNRVYPYFRKPLDVSFATSISERGPQGKILGKPQTFRSKCPLLKCGDESKPVIHLSTFTYLYTNYSNGNQFAAEFRPPRCKW